IFFIGLSRVFDVRGVPADQGHTVVLEVRSRSRCAPGSHARRSRVDAGDEQIIGDDRFLRLLGDRLALPAQCQIEAEDGLRLRDRRRIADGRLELSDPGQRRIGVLGDSTVSYVDVSLTRTRQYSYTRSSGR